MLEDFCMDKKKLTREEALRRWNASKELKRKMSEKLERLVRESCKGRDDNGTVSVEVWQIGGIDNMDDIFVWGHIGGECEWIDLGVE